MTTYQRRGTNGYPRIPEGLTPGITPLRRPQHMAPHPPPRISSGAVRDWNRFGPSNVEVGAGLAAHGFGYITNMDNRRAAIINNAEQHQQTQDADRELAILNRGVPHPAVAGPNGPSPSGDINTFADDSPTTDTGPMDVSGLGTTRTRRAALGVAGRVANKVSQHYLGEDAVTGLPPTPRLPKLGLKPRPGGKHPPLSAKPDDLPF